MDSFSSGYKDWNNSAHLQEEADWNIPKRIVSLGSVNMKRTMKKFIILLAAGLLAVSCIINIGGGFVSVGYCTEEGIDYTEIREVGAFDAISTSLPCKVYFSQADKQEVRVESTEEFAGKVITEVEEGTLKLKMEEGRYPKLVLRVVISSPDIESLQTRGSGDIVHEGTLRVQGDLTVKTSGSGDIRMGVLEAKAFTTQGSGSGDIRLEGVSCADFSGSVSGSGDLNFVRVDCAGFKVSTAGSGDISLGNLTAKGNAEVRTSGSGNIRLSEVSVDGDMELKTVGSGDITVNGSCHDVKASTTGSGDISGNLSFGHIDSRSSGSGRVRL